MQILRFLPIFLVLCGSAQAQILFTDLFNAGLNWREQGGCWPYAYQIVNDPCDATNKVVRVEIRIGDTTATCNNTWNEVAPNCPTGNQADCYPKKHRNELAPQPGAGTAVRPDDQQDWWLGLRMRPDPAYPVNNLVDWIVTQLIPQPGDGTDFEMRIAGNGQWRTALRRANTGQPRNELVTLHGQIARGEWVNWVMYYKRSTGNNGVFQLWKDGVLVVNWAGQTSQNKVADSIWKMGFYKGNVLLAQPQQTYVMLFDSVRIAQGVNQFNTVAPAEDPGPCVAPPDPDPPDPPAPTAEIEQVNFRFYDRFLDEGVKPLADTNTDVEGYVGGRLTLRLGLRTTVANADEFDFKLFWQVNGGGYTAITTTTTDNVYIVDNPERDNNSVLTNQLPTSCKLYAPKGRFKDADANAITAVLQQDTQSEFEYSLAIGSDASEGDVIDLRIEQSDGTDLDTYTEIPSITVRDARSVNVGGNK